MEHRKFLLNVLSAALISAGAISISVAQTPANETPAPAITAEVGSVEWVDQKIKDAQPTAKERKFDQIGWVTDIITAKKLAREHHRPIFLFTHDGRIATGRC